MVSTTAGNKLDTSDNPDEWEDNPIEHEDDEFQEFCELMEQGFAEVGHQEGKEEQDAVDQLHKVVEEVAGFKPERPPKTNKLPTIGFIQ